MKPGLAKIIEIVRISWYVESPEADLHIAENGCCMKYADTWSPKRVLSLSKSQSPHCGTSDYGCEDTLELYTVVARARLPLMGIHSHVASKPKIRWIPAIISNSGWMDDCQECHGSVEPISMLDALDGDLSYSHIAWCYHHVQHDIRSHGWCDASFAQEEDSIEGRLALCCDVSLAEAFQILHWSDSNDKHASNFRTHPWSFPEVAMV